MDAFSKTRNDINEYNFCYCPLAPLESNGWRKRRNVIAEANLRPGCKNMFLENFRNIFAFKMQSLQHILPGAQTRKHLGNIKESLTSNVCDCLLVCLSNIFWRCRIYFEDVEIFCFLLVCPPMQRCGQHWLKMFLKQCFLACVGLKGLQLLPIYFNAE